jgi:hypothetical protein
MRFCGTFRAAEKLSCPKQRAQSDGVARECIGAALLTVDHADRRVHDEAGTAQGLDRIEERSS